MNQTYKPIVLMYDMPGQNVLNHCLNMCITLYASPGKMEVVNLPSDKDSSGNVTKNLLQGRQLPTVLMDTHPDASSYSCFRPPQPRHSLKYSNLKETDSTDHVSGILFSPLANDPSCQLVDDKLPDNNRSKSRSQKIKRHPSSILQLSSSSPAVTSHTSEQTYHGHTFKVCSILRPWF